ncbi:hypothetical protein [Soonwooa sp.]|uniref:hypothetical protein n=1 Tax=Soonwooa sp. TaxID=1938592 RepID=UPI00261CD4ED|nr:hypothetical protein [Soonwooa sp.]
MNRKLNIKEKIFLLHFVMMPILFFSQQKLSVRFITESTKFIFDKDSYKTLKKEYESALKSERKADSIMKVNPESHITFIDCRYLDYPRFDSANIVFKNKIVENLDLKNTKIGQNTFSLFIDKHGKVKKIKKIKIADRRIFKQIKKMTFSSDFQKWRPANYYGPFVDFLFVFSVIIDYNFLKYNLKNKFSLETNLQQFEKL